MRIACFLIVGLASVSPAMAQTIFEPVEYKFGGQNPYYYGGNDPRVARLAAHPAGGGAAFGRLNGWAFASGNIHTHREVSSQRIRVFSDTFPGQEASRFGMTADDARNQAMAALPLYFRKADLMRSARIENGVRIVPASAGSVAAGSIEIRPWDARLHRSEPRPLLMFPREILQRRLPDKKQFAAAH